MSTVNGVGTLYYDWQANEDGTANATRWFVLCFLPIVPLKRERVLVKRGPRKKSGILDGMLALLGVGAGFEAQIYFLAQIPNPPARIFKTYLLAYLAIPVLLILPPILLMIGVIFLIDTMGLNMQKTMEYFVPAFGIGLCLWMGICIATILDRCAGRKHCSN
ncbi:MAG: hypothetical protein AAF483_07150 [Planctomycetota bacterium]